MSSGPDAVNKIETNGHIDLDVNTQKHIKALVNLANIEQQKINEQLQERLGIIVETYKNSKNKEGKYDISKDFTKLEKVD